MPIITLTTDFGQRDHYVACLKGVMLHIAPQARLIDVTHEIEPQNVLQAAFVLRQTIGWYPPGSIHLVVVDPGVGTRRHILAARYAGQIVVAPDNGIISLVHEELPVEEVRVVENPRLALSTVSRTFHGRDIMGPVAAHLAAGARLTDVGPPTDRVEVFHVGRAERTSAPSIHGRLLYTDAFGNLISNITADDVNLVRRQSSDVRAYLEEECVGSIQSTYSDCATGESLALINSCGLLEIAVNTGSAKDRYKPAINAAINVR